MSFGVSKSSSTPKDMTPQAFKNLQQPYADTLSSLLSQFNASGVGSNLIQGYQGPTTTPITQNEQTTLNQLQQAQNQNAANGSGTVSVADQIAQAKALMGANNVDTSSGIYSTDAASNPYLQSAIQAAQRPTQQALEETLTRDLPGRFTQAGQFIQPGSSSAFDRAAAIATRGAADSLGDIATNMSYSNYNDAAGRAAAQNTNTQNLTSQAQQNAVANAKTNSDISSQDVNSMIQNLQAQALPRLIQDLGVERGMEAFNSQTQALLAGLGLSGSTTQPTVANSSNQSSAQVGLK